MLAEKTKKCESIKSKIDFDENHYNTTNICHIFEKPIATSEDERKKVIDHRHLTGKYTASAHNICNLNYRILDFIPVKTHNLTGL